MLDGYTEYFYGDKESAEVEAKKILGKLDFNNNGSIDYSEFLIAHVDMTKLAHEDRIKEVFNLFDLDNSGTITIDEIKKVLGGGVGVGEVEEREWEQILNEVD